MKTHKIISRTIFALIFFARIVSAQTATTCSVYLRYTISTSENSVVSSPYFDAKIFPAFTSDDYSKILHITSQRIWKLTSAGDTLRNY